MSIDAISADTMSYDLEELDHLDRAPVSIAEAQNAIQGLSLASGGRSGRKPLMHKISEVEIGYKRTNADGHSDEVKLRVELDQNKGKPAEPPQTEKTTKTPDKDQGKG